jgi:hypothetical protein
MESVTASISEFANFDDYPKRTHLDYDDYLLKKYPQISFKEYEVINFKKPEAESRKI